LGVERDNILAW